MLPIGKARKHGPEAKRRTRAGSAPFARATPPRSAPTTTYLERIERWNPTLRAYVSVDADGALAAAEAADKFLATNGPEAAPPFLGVTISIKDVIGVKGLPTTHSSKPLADNVADAVDEALLLRFAAELEVAQPWADRVPPGFD